MEEEKTNNDHMMGVERVETPMGQVWIVVLATMALSGFLTYGFHLWSMRTNALEDESEANAVRSRIERLTEYKGVLEKDGVEAAETFLKNKSAKPK